MCDFETLRARIVPIPKQMELTEGKALRVDLFSKFCIEIPEAEYGPFVGAKEKLTKYLVANGFAVMDVNGLPARLAEEQGIVNGKTGFILPFDMSEIPVEEIYKGVKKFKCTPRESHYDEILSPGKSNYEYNENEIVEVKVLRNFFDLERNEMSIQGTRYGVKRSRARHLEELNLVETME